MMMLMSVSELHSLSRRHGNLGQTLRRTLFTDERKSTCNRARFRFIGVCVCISGKKKHGSVLARGANKHSFTSHLGVFVSEHES